VPASVLDCDTVSGMYIFSSGATPRPTLQSHGFAPLLIGIWDETANMAGWLAVPRLYGSRE
jgi:hypothetical protein